MLLDLFLNTKGIEPLLLVVLFNRWQMLNPLTPKISLAILLTFCHTVLVMLVWRIWFWINL